MSPDSYLDKPYALLDQAGHFTQLANAHAKSTFAVLKGAATYFKEQRAKNEISRVRLVWNFSRYLQSQKR